jgi:hypothetical protein
MSLKFPHIPRIFSASLWILLFALVSFNISVWITRPLTHSDKVFQIFTHPFDALAHEDLAQTLWNSGARTRASLELAIVAELSPVLGAQTSARARREAAQMKYWLDTAANRPDYRDAYIQLASLSYREGNLTRVHEYLLKAQILDPNNATVNRLTDFTSKLLE